jgi:hypothetical protein
LRLATTANRIPSAIPTEETMELQLVRWFPDRKVDFINEQSPRGHEFNTNAIIDILHGIAVIKCPHSSESKTL